MAEFSLGFSMVVACFMFGLWIASLLSVIREGGKID